VESSTAAWSKEKVSQKVGCERLNFGCAGTDRIRFFALQMKIISQRRGQAR
jgi:hypothetical protein